MITDCMRSCRTDEPEFVEWGYGGMGSVKNSAGQSSMWSRVQAGDDAAGLAKKTAAEDDDGSGTAWVKRRREQREREKREREEREKAEAEAKAREAQAEVEGGTEVKAVEGEPAEENKAGSGEVEPRKSEDESVETAESEETKETVHAPSQVQTGLPTTIITTPSAPSTPMAPDTPKLEHITQAITIPAHRPHHHHHHSHSYSQSHSHHYGHHHTFSVPHVERRESGETARAIPVSSPVDAPDVPKETQELVQTPTTMSETDGERESLESSALSTTSDEEDGEESPKDADGGFGQDEEEEEMEEEVVSVFVRGLSQTMIMLTARIGAESTHCAWCWRGEVCKASQGGAQRRDAVRRDVELKGTYLSARPSSPLSPSLRTSSNALQDILLRLLAFHRHRHARTACYKTADWPDLMRRTTLEPRITEALWPSVTVTPSMASCSG